MAAPSGSSTASRWSASAIMASGGLRWAVLGAIVLALVAAIALLARTVTRDLSALSTARSDTV